VFRDLCADVRLRIDARRREARLPATGAELAPNYAAALLQSIQRKKDAGDLDERAFQYCLAAAGEIFELEMIFFDSQFSAMIPSADETKES
jgi:hypothetical protein